MKRVDVNEDVARRRTIAGAGGLAKVAGVLLALTVSLPRVVAAQPDVPPNTAAAEVSADASAPGTDAEAPEKKTFGFFVNPLMMALGFFGAEFDVAPTSFMTVNVDGLFFSDTSEDVKTNAYGGGLGVQFFPFSGRAFKGVYFYPRVQFVRAEAEDDFSTASANLIAGGLTVGYQWLWDFGLAFRLGGGAAYYQIIGESEGTTEIALEGVAPVIDASIGFTL